MIRVHKHPTPPASLAWQAAAARTQLEQAFEDDPAGCQQPGTQALKSRRGIYAAQDVKQQLRVDQHHKCAYCETCFVHSSPGDVEHYRPKAGYRQAATGPLHGPGYYWLAYEWTNLLFACEDCNRIRKRQLFPLANDPVGRARTHYDDLTQEVPLLLNPATGPNPAVHLTFDAEVAIGLTAEGQASVAAYDLNRTALLAVRRDRLQSVRNTDTLARLLAANPPIVALEHLIELYGSVEILSWHIAEAQLARNRAALDAAEFAGMVRANFSHLSR